MAYEEQLGWLNEWFDRHEPVSRFIGLLRRQAERQARDAGIADIRVIDLDEGLKAQALTADLRVGAVLTADLRRGRLNLAVVDGKVVRAAFF